MIVFHINDKHMLVLGCSSASEFGYILASKGVMPMLPAFWSKWTRSEAECLPHQKSHSGS